MDEINIEWLDKKFLAKTLEEEEEFGNSGKIINFSVKPAVAPGNNYLSYTYRVRIQYEAGDTGTRKTLSLIVKSPIEEGFLKEITEKHNIFGKEQKIYSELLPSLNKISFCEFGPKSFSSPKRNVLVMKDLTEQGYLTCERTKQLDYFHCKIALKKLAKFHAASVVCLQDNEKLIKEVGEEIIMIERSSMEKLSKQALKKLVETICSDEKYAKLIDFFIDRADRIWPACIEFSRPKTDGGLNVLNHGDLWTNNILFKYNCSGEVDDCKFIDFQITKLGSPVNDLVYFIWTSANKDVREKRLRELIHIYLDELNKSLSNLGCVERMTVEELREDLTRAVDLVILFLSLQLPVIMGDLEDVPDFASLTDEDYETEKFRKLFKGKRYQKMLPDAMRHFVEFFIEGRGTIEL